MTPALLQSQTTEPAKLDRHAAIDKIAAVSSVICRNDNRWLAALGPDDDHVS
jgi:hypothetical protein